MNEAIEGTAHLSLATPLERGSTEGEVSRAPVETSWEM